MRGGTRFGKPKSKKNRPLSAALWLSTQNAQNFSMKNCVHAGDQGIWLKSVRFEVSRFLCHNFSNITKEKIGSWNPQWQTRRHGCITSLLKQKKLECKKSNKLLEPKISMCVNLLQESWHLSQDTCWDTLQWLREAIVTNRPRYELRGEVTCALQRNPKQRVLLQNFWTIHLTVWHSLTRVSFTWVVRATLQK